MPYDLTEVENELRSVGEEQYRVEEQLVAVQQQMSQDDSWLKTHDAATPGYQDRFEEWLSLEAYLAELFAQAACLDEVARELRLQRASWYNPDVLLAS